MIFQHFTVWQVLRKRLYLKAYIQGVHSRYDALGLDRHKAATYTQDNRILVQIANKVGLQQKNCPQLLLTTVPTL
jgi:hypothetical protein